MATKAKTCGYCGVATATPQREHVIPDCLYPPSKRTTALQLMTIVACPECNSSWQDAEVHVRNVVALAAGTNALTAELADAFHRSLDEKDGLRRMIDVTQQITTTRTERGVRDVFTPDRDLRFMLVIRKIVRGLVHKHKLLPFALDRQVWLMAIPSDMPAGFFDGEPIHHREADVVKYRYMEVTAQKRHNDVHSVWNVTLFDRLNFFGVVAKTQAGFIYSGYGSIIMQRKPPLRCRHKYKDRIRRSRRS